MDDLTDRFDFRECDILSAILEQADPTMLTQLLEKGLTKPSMRTRSSTYKRRIEPSSVKRKSSRYGFGEMELGVRYVVDGFDPHKVISAARLYAMRNNHEYWYERIAGGDAVRVCFMEKTR